MTTKELEQVIHNLIQDIYKAKYIGKLDIEKLPVGYIINFGMNTPEVPVTIYAELEDDKFIKFLKTELRNRHLFWDYFSSISLIYPTTCNKINTKCCDKR